MNCTTRKISTIVAKVIASIGALSIAVVIAIFVGDISNKYYGILIGNLERYPPPSTFIVPSFLSDPRLDVICALVIPIGIVLWWRRPSPASKPMLACCLGIAAAFAPVVVQIISRPFIVQTWDGMWAVGAVAVFASTVLAVCVTRRFLKSDVHDPSAAPIVPDHVRRGLIRLYAVFIILWAIGFSYVAHKANASIQADLSESKDFEDLVYFLENSSIPATSPRIENARRQLGLMAMVWDAKTSDEIRDHISAALDRNRDRLTNAIYALLAGVAPALLYPIFLWLLAGFRKSAPVTGEARPAQ